MVRVRLRGLCFKLCGRGDLAEFQCLPDEYLQLLLSGPRSAFWLWPSQTGALEAGTVFTRQIRSVYAA